MSLHKFDIKPVGPFSLEESNNFGFGHRHGSTWDGTMRLAFCVDGYREQAAVAMTQDSDGVVHCTVHGASDSRAVERQVARVLSLDHDATGFVELAARDPVIARLQSAAPGLRPPLFYSPYEAAAWAVLSARRPARQMAEVRRRLSEAHGQRFEVAGEWVEAFPTPERLLEVESFPGLPAQKIDRLHAVATAALDGWLGIDRVRSLDPDSAMAQMCTLPGVGPFYSALIVVRGAGLVDFAVCEPKAKELAAELWSLPQVPTDDEFREMAQLWRPFRTWMIVLIRAAGGRVLSP